VRQRLPGKPPALILGNEEKGIDRTTGALCDDIVNIPGSGRVQSLNVAAAVAILLYALPAAGLTRRDPAGASRLAAPFGISCTHGYGSRT
jgi:tRNA C32,U32 (ribose-2'-O)-methylase TrmJ